MLLLVTRPAPAAFAFSGIGVLVVLLLGPFVALLVRAAVHLAALNRRHVVDVPVLAVSPASQLAPVRARGADVEVPGSELAGAAQRARLPQLAHAVVTPTLDAVGLHAARERAAQRGLPHAERAAARDRGLARLVVAPAEQAVRLLVRGHLAAVAAAQSHRGHAGHVGQRLERRRGSVRVRVRVGVEHEEVGGHCALLEPRAEAD